MTAPLEHWRDEMRAALLHGVLADFLTNLHSSVLESDLDAQALLSLISRPGRSGRQLLRRRSGLGRPRTSVQLTYRDPQVRTVPPP